MMDAPGLNRWGPPPTSVTVLFEEDYYHVEKQTEQLEGEPRENGGLHHMKTSLSHSDSEVQQRSRGSRVMLVLLLVCLLWYGVSTMSTAFGEGGCFIKEM